MARALCWTALWDSARDAVTPAARYVDAVQRFGPAETGIGVLLNVLGNASTAIERYIPAAERGTVRRGFLTAAADQLEAAGAGLGPAAGVGPDGGRHQPLRRRRSWTWLRGILDGSTVIEGLAVDAELRWNLWHALAANGQATPEQLDAELARDNTAAGKSGHATALAARPDAAVKAAAWEAAVHGTALSNQLLSATIAGFTTAAAGLLAAYHRAVFRVPRARLGGPEHRDRQPDCARPLSRRRRTCRPADPAGHAPVIVRTDTWLAAHPDAPRALRRIIIEQRSHLHRALTAQALHVSWHWRMPTCSGSGARPHGS